MADDVESKIRQASSDLVRVDPRDVELQRLRAQVRELSGKLAQAVRLLRMNGIELR